MSNKVEMGVSYNDELGYDIYFDEGLLEDFNCNINKEDMVYINYGNKKYSDYEETKIRRKETIKNMLFNELFGKKTDELLEYEEFYFEGIFKRFEKYIIENDVFVEFESIDDTFDEREYKILFNKANEVITIIINDKRIRDVFGISINKDNSFELYTKKSKEELTKQQIDFLQNTVKDFVKRKLEIAINFGRDLNGPLKIKNLYNAALRLHEFKMYEDSEKDTLITKK